MKITVLGCGALGQIWLAALDKQGHEVQGWLRVPQPYCSVNVVDLDGHTVNKTFIANDPAFLAASELLIVTLKAWQVSESVKNLQAILPENCPVLLLHNGMGTLDELRGLPQPLLRGVTTHAAKRDGTVIVHVASGITHIGPTSPASEAMSDRAEMLHLALPDVAWHNNVASAAWQKLAVNCVINPLTVLYNCTNGELAHRRAEIETLCDEVASVMEREGQHISREWLVDYVLEVIRTTAGNTSSMLQDIRAQRRSEIDYINGYVIRRARAQGIATPENNRLYEFIKRKEHDYDRESIGFLVCLAPGSEETEAVTTIDLLVRAGLRVVTASVADDGSCEIVCSRGVRLLADAPLVEVADDDYAAIVLPGGLKGAECFRDSPLLVETVRQFNQAGRIVAAICAAPGTVLIPHNLFPVGNMTGFPGLKETIPEEKWMDRRVVWDRRVNLLTSQGPGTAIDFALKLIDLVAGKEKAREVAEQMVLAAGIYDYRD